MRGQIPRPEAAALPSDKPLVAYTRSPARIAGPGEPVKIVLNHCPEEFPEDSLTIRQVLNRKSWSFPLIIVRVNGVLVERKDWDSTSIRDGSELDLHHLLSGG